MIIDVPQTHLFVTVPVEFHDKIRVSQLVKPVVLPVDALCETGKVAISMAAQAFVSSAGIRQQRKHLTAARVDSTATYIRAQGVSDLIGRFTTTGMPACLARHTVLVYPFAK